MTIRENLTADREAAPEWLSANTILNKKTARHLQASRVVFYPGSGSDLHTLDVFGRTGSAHCFVHADYGGRRAPPEFAGYAVSMRQGIPLRKLRGLFDAVKRPPFPEHWHNFTNRRAFGRGDSEWIVYRRLSGCDESVGPRYLCLLHAGVEAVWLYWSLWASRNSGPYAVLLQDHGFGGNWARFGGDAAPLLEIAKRASLPKWLLVAENTQPWPEYGPACADSLEGTEVGAMHDHQRALYSRADASTLIER